MNDRAAQPLGRCDAKPVTTRIQGRTVATSLEAPPVYHRWEALKGRIALKYKITFGRTRREHWKSRILLPLRNRILGHQPISLKVDGTTVRLAPVEAMAAYLGGKPGPEIHPLRLLLRFLEPGQAFIDAGSEAGLFAIAVAKKIGHERVYAFEPSEEEIAWPSHRVISAR